MLYFKRTYISILFVTLLITTVTSALANDQLIKASDTNVTTVYLIRHTEKEHTGERDPNLTKQGRYRAKNWAKVFKDVNFNTVYSTDTTRTRDTAEPTAQSKNKKVELYSPKGIDYQQFIKNNLNKTVLVVGHSNTTPAFVNGLIGSEKYQNLDESTYSNLYIVEIVGDKSVAKVLTIEANKPTSGDKGMPVHEKINYLEYASRDLEASKNFFLKAFNWSFQDYGPDYIAFSDQGVDGGFYRADLASSTENGAALTVFYSDDLEQTLEKVSAAGGVIIKPIFSFPGGRRFHFTEPSGNEFAVWGE